MKTLTIEPIGLVRASNLNSTSALETVVDMYNAHNTKLLGEIWGAVDVGILGMAEVMMLVSIGVMGQELQARGWKYAPAGLFLGGKTEDGEWVLPQLGNFAVLNVPKHFAGRPDRYPSVHLDTDGVRAFGLTRLADVFTDSGEINLGIRFPVIRM